MSNTEQPTETGPNEAQQASVVEGTISTTPEAGSQPDSFFSDSGFDPDEAQSDFVENTEIEALADSPDSPTTEGGEEDGEETPQEGGDEETPSEQTEEPVTPALSDEQAELIDSIEALGITPEQALNHVSQAIGILNQLSSPDTARELIANLIATCSEQYGEQFEPPTEADTDLLRANPENLTAVEKALLSQNRLLRAQVKEAIDIARQASRTSIHSSSAETYEAAVRKLFPASTVKGAQIAEFMDKQGITDPVQAYKLMTYDEAISQAKAKAFEDGKKSTAAPKPPGPGTDSKTYDPNKVTAAEERMLLAKGYRPSGKAVSPFDRPKATT